MRLVMLDPLAACLPRANSPHANDIVQPVLGRSYEGVAYPNE